MRHLAVISVLLVLAITGFTQKPGSKSPATSASAATVDSPGDENEEFQKARQQGVLTERIAALKKFVEDFPKSEQKVFALELISSSRAVLGDQKLRLSDVASGIALFKLAASEAPSPVSNKFYAEILINLPTNLVYGGQNEAALEVARIIETKVSGNAQQLLGLAGFYLGIEQPREGKRLIEKAIEIEPGLPAAYQTLGLASRMDFDLEASVAAYSKAAELEPGSIVSKRSLAEVKRAIGKPDEAIELYQQILEIRPDDNGAQTGLILSLFDAGKRDLAEAAMAGSLEKNPGNLPLLVGAGYWYAANGEGAKAVDLAGRALVLEPRYTWTYIVIARGLMLQNKPLEAERTLLAAKQYGNFPTLNYEIASARLAAGLFREASDEISKSFSVKDGRVSTKLGGRLLMEGNSFLEILAFERRASIFQPISADDPETAERLKYLLSLSQTLNENDEIKIIEAIDQFVGGNDKMKVHRQLYSATRLLEKRTAVAKALELAGAAMAEVNSALDVTVPAAAVMADELYESRTLATTRNEILLIPEVPRQTLSRILRGRIEELAGWALFQQEKPDQASIRLKRAVSVLPEKSAWWRSSQWRLGAALEAVGKPQDALKSYLAGYNIEAPDMTKRIVIESLYKQVNNGSIDGLDQLIGVSQVPGIQTDTETEITPPTVSQPESAIVKTSDSLSASQKIPSNVPILTTSPNPAVRTNETAPAGESVKVPESNQAEMPPPAGNSADSNPDKFKISEDLKGIDNTLKTEAKTPDNTANQVPNPLFESIIITVPRNERTPPVRTDEVLPDTTTQVKKALPKEETGDVAAETLAAETKVIEEKPDNGGKEKEFSDLSVTSRPRVIAESTNETAAPENRLTECRLNVKPGEISILNDGGSLGMFVGYDGKGDLSMLKARSNSPQDITVTVLSDVGVLSDSVFYIIKSISQNVGVFAVIFDSPCGKKEIAVTVR